MIKKVLYIISMSLILAACQSDDVVDILDENQELQGGDMSLIGTAVNFQPYTEGFSTRANGTWLHDGQFNTGDLMYIYRQFWIDNKWTYETPPGILYKYIDKYNGVTGIFDKSSWKPFENKWFCFTDNNYNNTETSGTNKKWDWDNRSWTENDSHSYAKRLTANDSIIWESGKTVRFRAWILSNLGNDLADIDANTPGFKRIVYPDYLVCDWVTVAGPTAQIPMAMRHLGFRLAFSPLYWNVFADIQICTDPEDYRRDDNADSTPGADEADKIIRDENGKIITAEEAAANVLAVWNKMCWPAGVDIDDMSLKICDGRENNNTTYSQKTLSPAEIANNVKRPLFDDVASTSRWYMISTPYDMSNADTYGEPLHLPCYTRFKIKLRDVNNADGAGSGASENHYHIFSLSDAKKSENSNEAADIATNGIDMKAGDSYLFNVGYRYNKLDIWAADTGMSWEEQDLTAVTATDDRAGHSLSERFKWFTDAITDACIKTKTSGAYQPEFIIDHPFEFNEFIRLVNGEFKKGPTEGPNGTAEGAISNDKLLKKKVTIEADGSHTVEWYKYSEDQIIPKSELEEEGYIFYDSYTPAIGTQPSVIEEDYLKAPYTFYNEQVGRRWTVKLKEDIDLQDFHRENIGNKSSNTYFAGHFDGQGHTLKNLYCPSGVLFDYVKDGTIANLKLESTYPLSVVNYCSNERLLGISLKAPGSLVKDARNTCYFVGCIHEGDSNMPLVERGERVYMYGCMQAAYNGSGSGRPALGKIDGSQLEKGTEVLIEMNDARDAQYPWWDNIACNYYDTDLWKGAKAFTLENFKGSDGSTIATKTVPRNAKLNEKGEDVFEDGNITNYSSIHRKQYIRGVPTDIMCAKTDFVIDAQTKWSSLSLLQRTEIYGVAPWKAMNFAIYQYNSEISNSVYHCKMHYEPNSSLGFNNRYPSLVTDVPNADQYLDVMEEFN